MASLVAQQLKKKKSAFYRVDTCLIPGSERSPEEGNGNPPQYSCLAYPMDWRAWRATVHGVVKSQTQVSDNKIYFYMEIDEIRKYVDSVLLNK